MDMQLPYLPQDIFTNILKRLPVKSLLRFRCACKYWKNLLKTSSFIAAHLQHSHNQNPLLLFTRSDQDHHTLFDLLDSKMQQLEVRKIPLIDWIHDRIVGSCNGLLCFRNDTCHTSPPPFLLWNPATSEVRHVPRPLTDFDGFFYTGFGFNPITNDYRIVINYVDQSSREVNRVEVCSLMTGSWKEIDFGNLEGVSLENEEIHVNGVIFWFATRQVVKGEDGDDDTHMIVTFNIAMEVFTVIPMPDSGFPTLTVYEDNKLALLFLTVNGSLESSFVELWVMEEDTSTSKGIWSWTKKYTSDTCPCFSYPCTIWRSLIVCNVVKPELIPGTNSEAMNDEPTTFLYLFNLTNNELKLFPTGRLYGGADIVNYTESLVPLNNNYIEEP